jgi:hypothetical protein
MFNPAATPELAFVRPDDLSLPAVSSAIRSGEKSLIFGNIGDCATGARNPVPSARGRAGRSSLTRQRGAETVRTAAAAEGAKRRDCRGWRALNGGPWDAD